MHCHFASVRYCDFSDKRDQCFCSNKKKKKAEESMFLLKSWTQVEILFHP